MELTPPPADLSYNQTGTNHSFSASMSICTNCHGEFNGGSIQQATAQALSDLQTTILAAVKKRLNQTGTVLWVRAQNPTTKLYSSSSSSTSNVVIDTSANPVSAVALASGGGSVGLSVTLTQPVSITWSDNTSSSLSAFLVAFTALKVDASGAPGPVLYATSGNLYKALWNYNLINNDGSKGVHNPAFARNVINASMAKDLSL
jgi:hypothetical protein